ncbi:MAG TPA: 2'-deoxycytidine 5'-triphosphate deaminase [Terriglobia bacterium]|nr:2'-deoxycytidine 5'-triphosphate deaminase [Terriglobia bacterium]
MGSPSQSPRPERKTGILPSQEIRELIGNGKIRASAEISDAQIQPASMDLRLGHIAYRVQASFLPGRSATLKEKIAELKIAEYDLSRPVLLETNAVYVVPLLESLALPHDIGGKANPKSTTGRLDIFTRLITDGGLEFEYVLKGYSGDLYVEIVPRTFPIVVGTGTKLNQLRFIRGNPISTDGILEQLAEKERLVFYENGDGPAEAVIERGLKNLVARQGGDQQAVIDRGLRTTTDFEGSEDSVVAYKAKRYCPPVDLSKVRAYDAADFWVPIYSPRSKRVVLDPGDFYLMASKERFSVPPSFAAEMEPFDQSIGDFSVHYAGFFDPGFGYGESGDIKGTKAVLEVRAHEVPLLLEDRQIVGRLIYHRMANVPQKLYGQAIGSSYQQQGLALSKQFKPLETARSAALRP